ncbi:MAG: transcription-repair coupling factor, partial [Acidobacteria bacterium]|nr:transcription-repair coupling factor [Acidobacteriota bacterium]
REVDPYRGITPHMGILSARARALSALAGGRARVVVASAPAILPRLSRPERLLGAVVDLEVGGTSTPGDLADRLADAGFSHADPVETHGEFCGRGGVVDLFPAGDAYPVRVEFAGDSIESLRRFDPATQRSVATLDRVSAVPLRDQFEPPGDGEWELDRGAVFRDYTQSAGARFVVSEPVDTEESLRRSEQRLHASRADAEERGDAAPPPGELEVPCDIAGGWLAEATTLATLAIGEADPGAPAEGAPLPPASARHVACQPAAEFRGRLGDWIGDVRRGRERGDVQVFVAETSGRAERIVELLAEHDLVGVPAEGAETTASATVLVTTGILSRGFRLPDAGLQLYAETDLFEAERAVRHQRRSIAKTFLSDFRDLKVGDHVVHVDHGIGAFVGLRHLGVDGDAAQEFVELRYARGDKLFVPVEQLDLLQKYTGAANPSLDRLGGTTWEKAKTRVRKSMRDMADELLKLYAARKALPGYAFSADTHWQEEFEAAFEHELTPDQRSALSDIKRDMESPVTMDRLLCGDVGYGKTEVALRAAFKALMDGKQVALLTATTVLAFQHLETIRARFGGFPVHVAMLSRFVSRAEQKKTLADLKSGRVDLVVGTHRLLSKDVEFRDLGLLVVDEEQRFGVAHKERIKQLRQRVDVLTLTATPIPRTLNMSLAGIRDMSVIETPPRDRLAIQTAVVRFDAQMIARVIRTELERGGQVYLVHNRVESIHSIASLIGRLVPEARMAVAHGQTSESVLEKVMIDFVARRYDVLVATTIIENGLDIPNVNTIVVNHAERYGLAQLYQLRGRVGRADRRAYAYLVVPADDVLTPVAKRRLAALREFSELGSGFRIAALDLEIRGAGNLLGGEQSGHIEAIGFDMYVKLLEQTVRELSGQETEADERRARISLGVDLRIDESYVGATNQRLALYRRLAAAGDESELRAALDEAVDRYGPLHPSLLHLAEYGRIRILAGRLGVESIERDGARLVVKFRTDAGIDPARLVALVNERPAATLLPPAVLELDLAASEERSPAAGRGRNRDGASWWTARARTGRVTGGFTKGEVLAASSPRLEAGLAFLTRVSGLLDELSGAA